jgi:ABC-type bacteriocin/lantibiotic exporter with double-glycine peptidase domain
MTPGSHALLALLITCCAGCAGLGYTGAARDLSSTALDSEPGWIAVRGVPLYRQQHQHDCGPTALAMVLRYWDRDAQVDALLAARDDDRRSSADLRGLARDRGFAAFVLEGTVEDLVHEISNGRPVIVGVAKPSVQGRVAHYEVVVGIHPRSRRVATLDPAAGWRQNTYAGFIDEWVTTGRVLIVVLPKTSDVREAPDASAISTQLARPPKLLARTRR